MLERAAANGISESRLTELRNIVTEYYDVLWLRLGPGPPAKVEPLSIDLIEGSRPVREKQRMFPPQKREFLNRFASKLLEYGFIKVTIDAQWISAPLIVPKPPPAEFQVTFDVRSVNATTM